LAHSTLQLASAHSLALLVRLGESLHAIPLAAIEEVLPNLPLEPVPHCPPHMKGVVFVRGHLIPVLDARRLLGMGDEGRAVDPHIVCIRSGDRLAGLEVDEALDLLDFRADKILPADELGVAAGFLIGVIEHAGQVIRLLDAERIASK